VGLSAVSFALLIERHIAPLPALLIVLAIAPLIGLIHGLLVTRLRLQPFLVTLCGLFVYRGLSQWATWTPQSSSRNVGIGDIPYDISFLEALFLRSFFGVPWVLVLFALIAALVGLFLHGTVYGRYLYAIGSNEQAARYAGIPTDRFKVLAYMWCS